MPRKSLLGSCLLGLILLAAGCATWHKPATGETRDSVPTYPQCQKPEVVKGIDQECWSSCMDRWYRLRGNPNAAACDLECSKPEGRMVMKDDEACNAVKARQEGWVTK